MLTMVGNIVRRMVWIINWWIRWILQLSFFLPVKKNRILISAHDGLQYYCNPKYISEYLVASGADVEIIWGFYRPKDNMNIPKIKVVRIHSPAWYYYTATASVIITNHALSRAQPKRKGQLIIDTWHGGGAYKRVGRGMKDQSNQKECRVRNEFIQKIDLFLSSSKKFTEYAIRGDYKYTGEVLCSGMPRNDLFFDAERRETMANKVRTRLGIDGYVVIYAPTFRGKYWYGYRTNEGFPYQAVLNALRQRFGKTVTMLKRAHPGGIMADGKEDHVLDVTSYPDMQELMCAADMLITDYSSSMWDFALLGRPCLLYVPDLEDYSTKRGLCVPAEEWPGIACRNKEELLEAIQNLDEQACAEKAAQHLKDFGSYETGTATRQVCERIMQHIC